MSADEGGFSHVILATSHSVLLWTLAPNDSSQVSKAFIGGLGSAHIVCEGWPLT
jgi:hypothetical protein